MTSKSPNNLPMGREAIRNREIGDFVCGFLHALLVTNRESFERVAAENGIPLESQAAAVLCQSMIERGYIS